ncbi:ribose 5-phosphate isomerase B [bacterium]|nr:ribose 5-phosphate isomerase B [bacterium]
MKIFIASDHAGFSVKQKVVEFLSKTYSVVDLGPTNEDRTDYPDYADKVIAEIKKDLTNSLGVLICGSGQGMAMRANKYSFIRAALCWNEESAKLSRLHNDANVLCLGARLLDEKIIFNIVMSFFSSQFEGGRHADRVQKISKPC